MRRCASLFEGRGAIAIAWDQPWLAICQDRNHIVNCLFKRRKQISRRRKPGGEVFDQSQSADGRVERAAILSLGLAQHGIPTLSMKSDQVHNRAEALFKKEQRLREGQQAMAEYRAELHAMREKTARLRALRLARDGANQKTPPANKKGAA
jgi:hypothetical protein